MKARKNAERILSDPWETRCRDTLGQLFRKLEPFLANDRQLVDDLANAVRIRNRLAHSYWRDRAEDAVSLRGRDLMMKELIEFRDMFADLDARLTPVHNKLYESLGITDAIIKNEYDEMQRRVQERDKGYKPSS